jgi:hypothetical protein
MGSWLTVGWLPSCEMSVPSSSMSGGGMGVVGGLPGARRLEFSDLIISSWSKPIILSLNEKPTNTMASSQKNVRIRNAENCNKKNKELISSN